jgi:hypothetical protein
MDNFCVNGTLCFELAKGIPAAFVAFVIGCIAARVAYNQYLVAQAKLKLDLFYKRRAVFQKINDAVAQIAERAVIPPGQVIPYQVFVAATPDVEFLFDADVRDYLYQLLNAAAAQHSPTATAQDKQKLHSYFSDQYNGEVLRIFFPYLSLEKWK